jgi:L-2-hydroxyglutarate oxidase LhgO
MRQCDFLVIGAGIVGMTIARELKSRYPSSKIILVEKEAMPGLHASGRNSGVVHAGIYYPPGSLKAELCVEGHLLMLAYLEERGIAHDICGKVIVAPKESDVPSLTLLHDRAVANGAKVKKLSLEELREVEPSAHSTSWALWSPKTAILDSKAVLKSLYEELKTLGVETEFNSPVFTIDDDGAEAKAGSETYRYGSLISASGLHCDHIAHMCDVGRKYDILPFKGSYWKAAPELAARLKGLIYPVPDLNVPFLGVHVTKTLDGGATFGPSAMPALGREAYGGLKGIQPFETLKILARLFFLWRTNPSGFRNYVRAEVNRLRPEAFFQEALGLVGDLKREEIGGFYKAGIRPQLFNRETGTLEMDFVVEKGKNSIHILNAISPAFTCSFAFAKHVAKSL